VVLALGKIQRQLVQILGHDGGLAEFADGSCDPPTSIRGTSQPEPPNDRAPHGQPTPKSDTEVFNGEPSITHVLHEMEGHLEELGMANPLWPSSPSSQPLTPVYDRSLPEQEEVNPIQKALYCHGIVPDREKWDGILDTFCEEVYILYPFLHLPILRSTYENLWNRIRVPHSTSGITTRDRVRSTQLFFCLATGRCSESIRKGPEEGRHSAGWSLFQVGMDLLGNPLDIFDGISISLEALQAMILAVRALYPACDSAIA
jgi:hypothetical protein